MELYHDVTQTNGQLRGSVLAIGAFDGLHRGHQALFALAQLRARERGTKAAVLTFEPHPAKVVAPSLAPLLVLTLAEKISGIAALGIDALVVQSFDADFAAMPPRDFVDQMLVKTLGVSGVVVGSDFSFGHRGQGKIGALGEWLGLHDVTLDVVSPVMEDGLVCSSTKVREFVRDGRVDVASRLLGRTYSVRGVVEHGEKRGRGLKYPTANLRTERELLPRIGVYATRALLEDGTEAESVTNVGLRPTFDGQGVRIEAHLLEATGELYGQEIELRFVQRLRDEQKFGSPEELRAQIARDIESARLALRRGSRSE